MINLVSFKAMVCLLFIVAMTSAPTWAQENVFQYDETTTVVLNTDDGSTTLRHLAGGESCDLNITQKYGSYGIPFQPDQVEVEFINNQEIWLLSRLGKRLDGAIRLDLVTQELKKQYYGVVFSVSPDKQHIAFPRVMSAADQPCIFVDDTLVYPVIASGFTQFSSEGPKTENGTRFARIVDLKQVEKAILRSRIRWISEEALEFLVSDTTDPETKAYRRYTITGLGGKPDEIRAEATPISPDDAEEWLRSARHDGHAK